MTVTINVHHIYHEPVENVAATHLAKYPNKYDPNVVSSNIVKNKLLSDGLRYTKRIAICRNVLPHFLRTVPSLNVDNVEIEEECTWNRKTRTFLVSSQNLTWNSWVIMKESSSYVPHENKNWTYFQQDGSITVNGLGKIGYILELFGKRFLTNGAYRSIKVTERLMAERTQSYFEKCFLFWYSEFILV
ncbi:PRELI domain-containing protein 2 [Armadillidium nasatum]|uniref:PRELI domain-containing protein 2 n=1 Tax=Armadillidium nasatum TaxID=96803 RepID=A0A5N5TA75_9CRUS|nr:PRELI domain-containing protein 2 [Armadillidium nasatum]